MISRRALLSALPLFLPRRRRARRISRADRSASSCRSRPAARPTCSAACWAILQALWGQTVIPEYRPGAAGLIGSRQVVAAPADGHTLLMASTGAILALAASQGAARLRGHARARAVSLVAAPPYILVVNPAVPVRTAAELIAHAKANPGKLSFGSSGAGSASHLSGALFAQMAGVALLHVPYRGTGPAVTDLLGGHIDMLFSPALVVTPHIAAGTLRVIGTTGPRAPRCSRIFRPSPRPACRTISRSAGSGCSRRPARRARSSRRSAPMWARCWRCRRRGSASPSRARSRRRMRRTRSRHSSMRISPSGSLSRARPESNLANRKIPVQHVPVDRGQRHEVGGRDVLVDLVHLLAQQAELDHRAIILDEARIRGAAGGRQLRLRGRSPP